MTARLWFPARPQVLETDPAPATVVRRPRRALWRRIVERALGVVGVFALLYLVGINVLLRTRLLRNAISGPSQSFAVGAESRLPERVLAVPRPSSRRGAEHPRARSERGMADQPRPCRRRGLAVR